MTASIAEVNSILAHFDLPACTGCVRLRGGANQNLLVTLPNAETCVVKILELQRVEMLANDCAIQAQLRAAGLAAPEYIANAQGSILFASCGMNAVVSRQLAGVHCENLSKALCTEIGGALARFHAAVQWLPRLHKGWLNAGTAQDALLLRDDSPWVLTAQRLIAENLALFTRGLPAGIIHGDFHENNVLVESEANPRVIAVMDFEEAEENLLLVDVARTLLSVCRNAAGTRLEADKMELVVGGYETVRRLTAAERQSLPAAIRCVVGAEVIWLHQHGMFDEAAEHIQRAQLPRFGFA